MKKNHLIVLALCTVLVAITSVVYVANAGIKIKGWDKGLRDNATVVDGIIDAKLTLPTECYTEAQFTGNPEDHFLPCKVIPRKGGDKLLCTGRQLTGARGVEASKHICTYGGGK